MKLTTNHRKGLLFELDKAYKTKEVLSYRQQQESAKEDLFISEVLEIEEYLNNLHIEAIKSALCDEEIDY